MASDKHKHYKESYTAGGIRLSEVVSENSSDDEDVADMNCLDAAEPKFPEIALPEDTYGMILIAKAWTSPLVFSVVCICFQLTLVTLIVISLVRKSNSKNPFVVPIGVDSQVIGAQALAVPLAAFSAEDLLTALSFLFICVDDHVRRAIPEVTKTRWLIAFGSKAVEGLLCLATIFLLVVQSDTVIGLCLNFAALSFVWNIDDMFYTLGRSGYFSTQIRTCADRLSTTRVPLIHQNRVRYARNYSFYLFMAIMFALWLWIAIEQLTGRFLCDRLLVQFDDVYSPKLAKFSGVYHRSGHSSNYYAIYEGPKSKTSPGYPVIQYCHSLNVWTLSEVKFEKEHSECNWVAKSPVSYDHNIMSTSRGWFVKAEKNYEYKAVGSLPLVDMSIECLDCDNDAEPVRDNCIDRGTCGKDGHCKCRDGFYGLSCEFTEPCEKLVTYNRRGSYSVINGTLVFDNSFQLLRNEKGGIIMAQNRPVYHQSAGELSFAIFFDGYRWRLVKMEDEGMIKTKDAFANYHPYLNNYAVIQISDPMLISSPNDRFVPAFFNWYKPLGNKVDILAQTEGSLVCDGCSDLQQCRHNGECKNGRCICKECSEGTLCEIISDLPQCNSTESVDFY